MTFDEREQRLGAQAWCACQREPGDSFVFRFRVWHLGVRGLAARVEGKRR